jgi:hypothetical protein
VVLNLVLIGVAVALDPLPLMAFLVVLPSKRGVRKGAAFVFGWLASLVVVVAVTVLATGNNPPKPNHLGELDPRLLAYRQQHQPGRQLRLPGSQGHPRTGDDADPGRDGRWRHGMNQQTSRRNFAAITGI